jgi:hypothetical protein
MKGHLVPADRRVKDVELKKPPANAEKAAKTKNGKKKGLNRKAAKKGCSTRRRVAMAKRLIFTVATPLGYRVSLSRDRWRQIIRFKHPALAGHENDVRNCLQNPACVRESAKDKSAHLFYTGYGGNFLCVVTAPTDGDDRFVVTAYFTTNIKEGTELWRK